MLFHLHALPSLPISSYSYFDYTNEPINRQVEWKWAAFPPEPGEWPHIDAGRKMGPVLGKAERWSPFRFKNQLMLIGPEVNSVSLLF